MIKNTDANKCISILNYKIPHITTKSINKTRIKVNESQFANIFIPPIDLHT